MAIGKKWAGKLYGTNTGNLYVTLEGEDHALEGNIHLNDVEFGLVVYAVAGTFDGDCLQFSGAVEREQEGLEFGKLTADAHLNSRGELVGDWSTTIGSAGTFVLFPHDRVAAGAEVAPDKQEQMHTARHDLGAIAVDRQQLTDIAEELQMEFPRAEVVVTVCAGTERSCLLGDFPEVSFTADRATLFKLYARQRDASGIDRVAVVEFGPQMNYVMTQGSDEAWVLGMLEKLKLSVKSLERRYATSYQKYGFGINQVLFFGAIVYLPSLPNLETRAVLMIGVLLILWVVTWLNGRYLPHAVLYLAVKSQSFWIKVSLSALSWGFAVTSALVAALLAHYLQGQLPASP